jgi:type III restriction enzyme
MSEVGPRRHLFETFADAINKLTLVDAGTSTVISEVKLSKTRPVVVNNQPYVISKKTVFNRIIGDSNLELRFAQFLDAAKDVQAFAKNTRSVHFYMEYITATGEISHYYPDFIVRDAGGQIYIIETKGLQDLDVVPKWNRLVQWCEDATSSSENGQSYVPLFISEEDFNELETKVKTMAGLAELSKGRKPTGA